MSKSTKPHGPGYGISGPEPAPLAPPVETEKLPPTTRFQKYQYDAGLQRTAYLKAIVMLIMGLGIVCITKLVQDGSEEAGGYLLRYAMTLGVAIGVYILSCFGLVEFSGTIVLTLLAIAGGVAMADLSQFLLGQTFLVYALGLPWVIAMAIYGGIISDLLDLDFSDAAILAIVTYGAKVMLKFTVFDQMFAK